jgi:hypothetical protein
MIVTPHSLQYLIVWAKAYNNDINAIYDDGVRYDAVQIYTEDDHTAQ